MKNFLEIAIFAFLLIFAASCEDMEPVKPSHCHTELVPAPLETSVVADEMVVRTGQSISGLVKDHQKKFLNYTKDMFLADNPEIASRPTFSKLDPCDSSKVKYTTLPIYAGEIVYLRHPYRIDTVPGNEVSVVWKTGSGRLRHVIDMDDEGRFVVHDKSFVCDEFGAVTSPNDGGSDRPILPPNGSGSGGWWSDLSNWLPWLLLGLLLGGFIMLYRRIGDQHEQTRGRVSAESNEIRTQNLHQHNQTRNSIAESMKNLGSELSQAITAEGKASRELLERQLDAERKSREKEQAQFFKLLADQGKGPKKPEQ